MKLEREFISDEDREEREMDRQARHESAMERGDYLRDEMIDRMMEQRDLANKSQNPQDGRICKCEDAPCCGCYDL